MKLTKQDYERIRDDYCTNNYFKEYRVAIIITDQVQHDYRECADSIFLDLAEEQGHTFTLNGFTRFIESGQLLELMHSVPIAHYLFVRFIPMFQKHLTPAQLNGEEHMPEIFCSTTKKLGKDGEL